MSATESHQAGFTLVEALCAIVILALGFVALFQGLSGSQRNSGRLDELASERQILRSLMAETVARPRTVHMAERGRSGAFQWSISQSPLEAGWAASTRRDRWQPYIVTYEVMGPRQSLKISSVRLLAAK